jgi:hypothetical protein
MAHFPGGAGSRPAKIIEFTPQRHPLARTGYRQSENPVRRIRFGSLTAAGTDVLRPRAFNATDYSVPRNWNQRSNYDNDYKFC